MVIIGGKGLRPMVKVKEKEKDTAHRKKGVFLFPVLFLFVPITLRTAQSSFYNPSNLEKQALLPQNAAGGWGVYTCYLLHPLILTISIFLDFM